MAKIPSPCVDVCKFKLNGRCIGCAMTKKQKKMFRRLKSGRKRLRFITDLVDEQTALGRHDYWRKMYLRKCKKKGAKPPLAA